MGIKGANSYIWKHVSNDYYKRRSWSWTSTVNNDDDDDDDDYDLYIDAPSLVYYLYYQYIISTTMTSSLEYLVVEFIHHLSLQHTPTIRMIYLVWDGVAHVWKRSTQIQRMVDTSQECFQRYHCSNNKKDPKRMMIQLHSVLLQSRIQSLLLRYNKNHNNQKQNIIIIDAPNEAEIHVGTATKNNDNNRGILFLSDDSDTLVYLSSNRQGNRQPSFIWIPFRDFSLDTNNYGWNIISNNNSSSSNNKNYDDDASQMKNHVMTCIAALAGCDYVIPSSFKDYQNALNQSKQLIVQSKIGGLRPKYQNHSTTTTITSVPAHLVFTAVSRFVYHFYNRYKTNNDWIKQMTAYISSNTNRVISQDTLYQALIHIHGVYFPKCNNNNSSSNQLVCSQHVELQRVFHQQTFYCRPIVEGWNQTYIVYCGNKTSNNQFPQQKNPQRKQNSNRKKRKNKNKKRRQALSKHNNKNDNDQDKEQNSVPYSSDSLDCEIQTKNDHDSTTVLQLFFQELYFTYYPGTTTNNKNVSSSWLLCPLNNASLWNYPTFMTCRRIIYAAILSNTKSHYITEYNCVRGIGQTMECREIQIPIPTLHSCIQIQQQDDSSSMANENFCFQSSLSSLFQHVPNKKGLLMRTKLCKKSILNAISFILTGHSIIYKTYHRQQQEQHENDEKLIMKMMLRKWEQIIPLISMTLHNQFVPSKYESFYWSGLLLLLPLQMTSHCINNKNNNHGKTPQQNQQLDSAIVWFILLLFLQSTKDEKVMSPTASPAIYPYSELDLFLHMELSYHHIQLLVQAISFQHYMANCNETVEETDDDYVYEILKLENILIIVNHIKEYNDHDTEISSLSSSFVFSGYFLNQKCVESLYEKIHSRSTTSDINQKKETVQIVMKLIENYLEIQTCLESGCSVK